MGKFRDNTGIILWILIGSFGLLWVIMDVFDPNALSATPRALGSVNGDQISFDEYNSRIQYYTNAYSQQTGSSMTAETRAIYENQVWDDLVSALLLKQKMDELGITVTDQELLDMAYGDNPDPLIRQYFSREDGSIDRFMVQNVLSDEQYTQEAIAIELQLRQKRRQEKLTNFITAGLQVTDQDVLNEYMKRNSFSEFSFLRFPYNEVDESEITVSESELKDYYDKNKEKYKSEESYRAKFVSFSTLPTSLDSVTITKEVADLAQSFASAENDSLFLLRQQSTTPFNNVFVKKSELREDYAPVLDVKVGEVTGVIDLGTSVAIIKKIDENRTEIKFAVFSRIFEALPSTLDDAAEKADEFQFYADEETSFEEEAERAELDVKEVFATKGSTFISGLGSSQQALNFLTAAGEGDISSALEIGSQFVIIKLEDKTPEGYRPFEEVKAQIETQVKNEKRKAATVSKVNTMLASNSTLESLAASTGKEVQAVDNLVASATTIAGAGREPGIVGSIFSMSEGQTSKALAGMNAVYVVMVESLTKPDPATLDQATAATLRNELEQKENQRYLSVWLEQLKDEADIEDNRDRVLR